jgi:beta-lactamase class A
VSFITSTNKLFKSYTVDIFVSTILVGLSFNLALFIYKVKKVSATPIENQYYFSKEYPNTNLLGTSSLKSSLINEKPLPEENKYDITLQVGDLKEIEIDQNLKPEGELPDFAKIVETKLILKPSKNSVGDFTVKLVSEKTIPSIFRIQISNTQIDMEGLKKEVNQILSNEAQNYGVYIYDITRDSVLGLNHDKVFPPASISKVPIAILALRDVDAGKLKLTQTYQLKKKNQIPGDGLSKMKAGSYLTLDQYINYMIVQSDNTAMTTIEEILGGTAKINQRSKDELGIKTYFRDPHEATAQEIGNVMFGIYKGKYLSKTSNDYLLNYLKNTGSWLQDRIPAKLPKDKGIEVAHKIGQISTEKGCACADAGIVYGEKADFIVVVINEDTTMTSAREKISSITRVTYEMLNK